MQLILTRQLKAFGNNDVENKKKIVEQCHNEFKTISGWIQKNNGTEEDSEDIFNDAVVILLDKIGSETLTLHCQFSTYFFSICKHLWFHECRKRRRMILSDDVGDNYSDSIYDNSDDEKYELLNEIMDNLDERSKEMFKHILNNRSYAEITQIMNFKNAQAVADKKKNCIKKIVSELANNSKYRNRLNEISEIHRVHSI
jgi:RNA polymerase sigma factor (sigma-70 family)